MADVVLMSISHVEETLAFQLRAAKIGGWKREVAFKRERRWRFDFAFLEEKVAIEVEGGQSIQGGGRHQRSGGFALDCLKYAEAAILGWTVLRFTSSQVIDGTALDYVERVLAIRRRKTTKRG